MHDGNHERVFDWWPPACTATWFIIVTIVEIHRLNLDVCVT